MPKPKKYVEEIKHLSFTHKNLQVNKNDTIEYFVAKHQQSAYNSLYENVKRFYIIHIEEVDIETRALYQEQTFSYKFKEPGIYTISCLNYPRMQQTVIVKGDDRFGVSTTDLGQSDVTSIISKNEKTSLFKKSVNATLDCLDYSQDQNSDDVEDEMNLINEGFSSQSIKHNSKQLRDTKVVKHGVERLEQITGVPRKPTDRNSLKNDFLSKGVFGVVIDETDDLYKVHQLNKLSPNNLFVLLKKLKTTYVKEEEVCNQPTFQTFDDMALYCKKTFKREPPKSNFDNRAIVNRALANIQRRFS